MDKYKISVLCENCQIIVWFYISKGVTIKDFFGKEENKKCRNCGCNHGRTD